VTDALHGRLLDGRYRIGPRIARGGMASVYEALDTRLDRVVAVKIMHVGLGDHDEFAARFVREARAAARISHPHVVAVYDQGDDDGTVYLAMEYVPGHTLRDVIRKEAPMSPQRALALLEPVVSAIAAAHRAGLIHRDIKPENVLISDEATGSRIKVADFGLARAVSTDTQHTVTGGVLIGTVSYLAPELVVEAGRADARADVYALGVLLYELLTGTKPHEGESPIQVAYKHVNEDVPAPSSVVPGLPSYVDALVERSTARERIVRPADAGVLLHQLHRVSSALAEGLVDDPELTADLRPLLVAPTLTTDTQAVEVDVVELVSPAQDPDHERTSALAVPGRAVAPAGPTGPPVRVRPTPIEEVRPRRRRRWRGPLTVLLAVLLVSGIAVGAWWFNDGRWTRTPGVLNQKQAAALATLEEAGLTGEVGAKEFSETVPAGRVISSDPAPGERVLGGGDVTLVVSKGKERYDVPKVKGKSVDQAQDLLTSSKLLADETIERWSETVEAGIVIRSIPAAGTSQRRDTPVDLVVSKGPQPIKLGSWVGKDAAQARETLEGRGLVVDTSQEEYSDDFAQGEVISQSPETGPLHRGDTVTFVVSKGPELVEVPGGLRAMGVEAATELLEGLGFVVDTERSDAYLGIGFVYSTDPGSGEMVPKGSTITLYLV